MNITNKTILITGANRGIGRALVEEALRKGAKRVYAGTRGALQYPDKRVTPLTLDVTNAEQIRGAADEVESLDILINNAGISPFDDLSDRRVIEQQLAVNLFGPYDVTQAFLPLLTRSRGSHCQRSVVVVPCRRAVQSGLLRLKGGRVLPVAVAAHSFGRTGCQRPSGSSRPRGHGHDTRPGHTEVLSGVRCAGNLGRSGERGGGNLP